MTTAEHITTVTKGNGVSVAKNPDGTLASVDFDSGVSNLIAIDSVNPGQFTSSFSIQNGRILHITGFEKLPAPMNFRISALDSNGTYTLYTFDTQKGSTNLMVAPQVLNNVPKEYLEDFKTGKKSIEQIRQAMSIVIIDTPTVQTAPEVTSTDTSITAMNQMFDADAPVENIRYQLLDSMGIVLASNDTGVF